MINLKEYSDIKKVICITRENYLDTVHFNVQFPSCSKKLCRVFKYVNCSFWPWFDKDLRMIMSHVTWQGPEIRTGFLNEGKPIQIHRGQEITITTDYSIKGDENMISMSYKKLAHHLSPGSNILCADGTISFTVLECDKENGLVRCHCENSAVLGERKNVNLPGVVVDLPTLTEKDKEDILEWGVPNKIDIIALSFVRKGSDLVEVRNLLGKHAKSILLMSKVSILILK